MPQTSIAPGDRDRLAADPRHRLRGRARPVVLAAVMRRLGIASDAYAVLEHAPVLGHGEPVGSVVAVGI